MARTSRWKCCTPAAGFRCRLFWRTEWLAAAFALCALLYAGTSQAGPNAAVFLPEKLGRIDDYFNNEVATGKIPGAMVLIRQHGQQIYFKSFGVSDPDTGRPMT